MPTSTFLSYELVNVGPLTTTFTAPAACETTRLGFAHYAVPYNGLGFESCPTYSSQGSCVPSGSEIDAISKTRGRILWDWGWAMPYFSPGLHCPDGYTTAGVAEMSANGETSVTGIFTTTSFDVNGEPWTTPPALPPVNMVASALEEGETAVICCKSGFTADALWGCYSNYPATSFTATEYCAYHNDLDLITRPAVNVTFTYNGETMTGLEWSSTPSPTTPPFTVVTSELSDWNGNPLTAELVGLTTVQLITLIHRGGSGSVHEESESSGTAAEESSESTGDSDSGAISVPRVGLVLIAGLTISAVTSSLFW